jgi:flagellar basal body-associated protein FliL
MRKRKPITAVLIVCVAAALALPAAAGAMYQFGDSPTVATHEGIGSSAPAPSATSTPAPSIVVNHTSTTLPTVLAAVSLGIALTGTAYVAMRLRSLPRT